jgi:protein tyrosine phosphatase (PTP) superfamily phosphohydrolase (DUF442 family)
VASTDGILNFIKVSDEIATGGQPTEEQLEAASAEGFAAVINLGLLEPRYALPDEAGLVRSLGMAYTHIPVLWEDPRESDFEAFERAMDQRPAGRTLIHCAANFRVTAFYSLYARKRLGWSAEQAAELRARIWKGRDNPVWERFVGRMTERIEAALAADKEGKP